MLKVKVEAQVFALNFPVETPDQASLVILKTGKSVAEIRGLQRVAVAHELVVLELRVCRKLHTLGASHDYQHLLLHGVEVAHKAVVVHVSVILGRANDTAVKRRILPVVQDLLTAADDGV